MTGEGAYRARAGPGSRRQRPGRSGVFTPDATRAFSHFWGFGGAGLAKGHRAAPGDGRRARRSRAWATPVSNWRPECAAWIKPTEGGNNRGRKADKGGPTNHGITEP